MESVEFPIKRLRGEGAKDSATATRTMVEIDGLGNDNSSSCSSNLSVLLSEADKAVQESNKRHLKPVIEESKLGIEIFIGDTRNQFHGLIKTRYADFIVHEISLNGEVAELTDLEPPVEEKANESLKLEDLFDRKILVCLSNVNNGLLDSYEIDVTGMDKETRTSVHHAIRGSYDRLESSTIGDGCKFHKKGNKEKNSGSLGNCSEKAESPTSTNDNLTAKEENDPNDNDQVENTSEATSKIEKKYILVTRRNKSSRQRSIWPRGQADYTQFVLYKENKDTMDAIHNLAVATNSKPSIFTYAGTKDRRAITTQWVSCWRLEPKRLIGAMRRFNKRPYLKVGNFSFQKEPIRLGQLRANRFDLVIRNLVHNSGGQQVIEDSIQSIKEKGFVNYFGLQRFGTRTTQTHEIGLAILQSKWDKAVDMILSYRFDENYPSSGNNLINNQDNKNDCNDQKHPSESDGQKSARQQHKYWARGCEQHNACIDLWRSKHDADLVFKKFPHFRMTNEGLIIKSLSKSSPSDSMQDYSFAISSLPRNTRSMYVHSYQSLLWNKLTTFRLKKHGFKVIQGDLVLSKEANSLNSPSDMMLASIAGDDSGEIPTENRNDDFDKVLSGSEQQVATVPTDAQTKRDLSNDIHSRILTVSDEDIDKYTIFDVVVPLPGSRVKLPQNDVGSELERLLKEDGLNLDSFRAREKVFVSYGSYRKILVKPDNLKWDIRQYSNPKENLIETDLDKLNREFASKNEDTTDTDQPRIKSDFCDEALMISFDLPSSSYATMCLRELMKKPSTDFNNRF